MTTAEGTIPTAAAVDKTRETIRTWSLIALTMFLLSLVLWIGFLTVGGIFFTLSDGVALLMASSMIPVMVGFDRLLRPTMGGLSRTARWAGIIGMVVAAAGSIVLLTSDVSHEFIPASGGLGMQLVGFGLEGVWFVLLGVMASRTDWLSSRLAKACYVAGAGFLMGVPGSVLGPEHPIVALGGVLAFVGFVLWAIWTRKDLNAG
jgi:hypothetical protein